MVEFLFGIMFGWWMWPLLFIVALFFEAAESHWWAGSFAFLTLIAFGGAFNLLSFSVTSLLLFIVGYLGLGAGHSVFRWYRYTSIKTDELNALGDNPGDYKVELYLRDTNFREQLDRITYWFLMWPISSLAHLFRDTIDMIRKFVVTWFSNVYDRITNRARGKVKIDLTQYQ